MIRDRLIDTVKQARASIDSADEDVLAEVVADAILAEMPAGWRPIETVPPTDYSNLIDIWVLNRKTGEGWRVPEPETAAVRPAPQAGDVTLITTRLRRGAADMRTLLEAADLLAAQAAEIARLRGGRAAPATPKAASEMDDMELQLDFAEHCLRWDRVVADRDGHSGSPGEWIVERLDELKTEAKRRRLALVEPPRAPAAKEPEA